MRVPVAWLRDYVDLPDDAGEIVARLAALGFPVDEVEERPALSGVVVGRIAELARHPNADRLQVCTVDVGADRALTIATAATNVAQGQVVPVARIGAHLAGGLTIAPRTMRGIDSEGMLISAEEVGLPGEWFEDGIMQLESATPIGADAIALLRLTDPVLDVEVTPNRPDALAIVGLARELAASFGIPLREPSTDAAVVAPDGPEPRVTIETFDCRRFVFQRARGLRVGPAPAWMRVRLALAGQRPIDNVVDVSNFVMLELGQPLHFFDDARIANGHLTVRDAREGERFTTLDTVERELDPRAIVICDDDGPTSLAGIMGGRRSEVSAATTDVLIEAASWSGPRVRRASTALKLRTEASSRFEKSLPLALAELGAARAAHLLAEQGALLEPRHVAGTPAPAPRAVRLAADAAQRLLGFEVSPDDAQRALGALGFATVRERDDLLVTPPYWRDDVAIAADVVEELARMIGYDRVR
ncbi:MAG: phenylalanine--tRNA ligase subunit beta, partial [Candidatus Eremiobacteraeota bacterium]|nr:phenylalanine--tRNA ligase subunit beta [Candidatus Eremiobacteraeota bacterium]